MPSGNPGAAHVLLTLAKETGRTEDLEKAGQTVRAFASGVAQARHHASIPNGHWTFPNTQCLRPPIT